jgi:hypothetical protein
VLELCHISKRTCAFEMREFQYCIFWHILYNQNDHVNEDEVGGACSVNGGEKNFI